MLPRNARPIPFFTGLTSAEIKQVLAIAHIRRYRAGELVFMKEELGNSFFIVRSGKIKIFTAIGGQKKKIFAFLGKGDVFGEMSLLGGKVRSASAEAVEESELFVISRKDFKGLILENPDFMLKLLHTLVIRLNRCDQDVEAMLYHNVRGRLADAILDLTAASHARPLKVRISQRDLAEYMGTTRVPVCRAISTLKRSGIIDFRRGEIIVLDIKRLRSISGNRPERL